MFSISNTSNTTVSGRCLLMFVQPVFAQIRPQTPFRCLRKLSRHAWVMSWSFSRANLGSRSPVLRMAFDTSNVRRRSAFAQRSGLEGMVDLETCKSRAVGYGSNGLGSDWVQFFSSKLSRKGTANQAFRKTVNALWQHNFYPPICEFAGLVWGRIVIGSDLDMFLFYGDMHPCMLLGPNEDVNMLISLFCLPIALNCSEPQKREIYLRTM